MAPAEEFIKDHVLTYYRNENFIGHVTQKGRKGSGTEYKECEVEDLNVSQAGSGKPTQQCQGGGEEARRAAPIQCGLEL